ncbi:hypothetical protein BDV19DRAFT_28615 [Aspergillus venezuelensis]
MSFFLFHNYRIPIRILYIPWVCTCTLWLDQMTNKFSYLNGLLTRKLLGHYCCAEAPLFVAFYVVKLRKLMDVTPNLA